MSSVPGTRSAQIVLLVLLTVSAGQIVFWVFDEVQFTREVRAWRDGVLDQRVEMARRMLEDGTVLPEVQRRFPDLVIDGATSTIRVPAAQRSLNRAAVDGRIRRFIAEGAFFLGTLVIAAVIVARALSQRARIARLQANFLAAVTHELKSPLASIRLGTETMLLREGAPESRERKLRRILIDLDRLERMVSNILEERRLDEGGAREGRRVLDLGDFAREAVDHLAERRREQDFDLQLQVEPGAQIHADPSGVRVILQNLLDNALKAIEGRETPGCLRVEVVREGDRVCLQVEDDGVGFPPEEASRLFERFYRVGDELRRRSRGSGLGLDLVARCARRDGAEVEALSEGPGSGARFRVQWPAARESAA